MKSSIGVEGAVRLERGTLARIADGKGAFVCVWDGALWVTQEGDQRDYYVAAGESFRIARDGVTLINALRRAVVTVGAPRESAATERLTTRLVRLWVHAFARHANPTTAAL